jgi:hypothetical protein
MKRPEGSVDASRVEEQVTGNRLQGTEKPSPEGERTGESTQGGKPADGERRPSEKPADRGAQRRARKFAVREWTVALDCGRRRLGAASPPNA